METFDFENRQQASLFKLKGPIESGSLSPDGSKYCYSVPYGNDDNGLWVYVFSTNQHLKVGSSKKRPQWSGSGDKIIYEYEKGGLIDKYKELWEIDSALNERKLPLKECKKYRMNGNLVLSIATTTDYHYLRRDIGIEVYDLGTGAKKSFDLSSQGITEIKDLALYTENSIIFTGSKGYAETGIFLLDLPSAAVKRLLK